ncbi:hypothetical protein AB0L59_14665 [Streptomyces sp. NPDC052109]|uniref:hypothetical protein n=1 Tax=Streptomyces sp. NPDC052109 TaxID=3155527 RepID=UPI00341EDA80
MILAQPAAGTAGARHRSAVRPSVLVAVLLGLFLMHGGPAAAAGGCHGATPDTAVTHSTAIPTAEHPAHHPGMTAEHPERAAGHPQTAAGTGVVVGGKAALRVDEAMRGALCQATTPRSEIPAPPGAAVALLLPAAGLLPWVRPGSGGTRRRGPPGGGRPLLLQVCVART